MHVFIGVTLMCFFCRLYHRIHHQTSYANPSHWFVANRKIGGKTEQQTKYRLRMFKDRIPDSDV